MHQEPGDHRERERDRQTERQTERETSLTDVSQRHAHGKVHGLCTSPETSADDGLMKQAAERERRAPGVRNRSGCRVGRYATGPGEGGRVRTEGSGFKFRERESGLGSGGQSYRFRVR